MEVCETNYVPSVNNQYVSLLTDCVNCEYPAAKTSISTVALWYIVEHNLFLHYPDILPDEVFSDCQLSS